eukprot:TRINITY_DN26803_c0_g1_i1.p1 TRINITY_DN26803_c0_g1~~TRINITY_DN26803_c0_g1_i1.p1  ORF type:complete len:580 (-),score=102.46 TRINITY_DN26803_c0_g1_i1:204-1943(-)
MPGLERITSCMSPEMHTTLEAVRQQYMADIMALQMEIGALQHHLQAVSKRKDSNGDSNGHSNDDSNGKLTEYNCKGARQQKSVIPAAQGDLIKEGSEDVDLAFDDEDGNNENDEVEMNPRPSQHRKTVMTKTVRVLLRDADNPEEFFDSDALDSMRRQETEYANKTLSGKLRVVLTSHKFDMVVCMLLTMNVLFMGIELQHDGIDIGNEIGYAGYSQPAAEAWPNVKQVLWVGDLVFEFFFLTDVVLRILVLRREFWCSPMNYIDFIVVTVAVVERALAGILPIPPTLLRLLRLGKLVRALKMLRMSKVLDVLSLLIKCIEASMTMLFWTLCVLCAIQVIAGMMISNLTRAFLEDQTADVEARQAIFRYYGTFTRTILTMFEVLFANWSPPCRVLMDNVAEEFFVFFLVYRCLVGFAVLNVVNAVFVQQTMKVAQNDEDIVYRQREKAQSSYTSKLKRLFEELDESGDGILSKDEFDAVLKSAKLKFWMSQLDIETHDLISFFDLLDDGSGMISVTEFLEGALRLKGNAKTLDMAHVMKMSRQLICKVDACTHQTMLLCKACNVDLPEDSLFVRGVSNA